jgi:regulator of protease activity HflC (stomatin/prohibitin superfamily)
MDVGTIAIILIVVVIALIILFWSIKVFPEYQRGVIFRLGRLIPPKGPGLFFIIPIVDRVVRVDLRTITMDVPAQEVITKDNVPVKVNAVVYFRVLDPSRSVVQVQNHIQATSQIAQTTLRSVLGQSDLDHLLTERDRLNTRLQEIIDEQTDPWGVKVSIVEIKDVEIPGGMQRAMARQAEAERERRAKVIAAEGEFQASEKLSQAAEVLMKTPASLQLRYLQTLSEIAAEKNSTTIFPVPIDLIEPFLKRNLTPAPGKEA